MTFCDWITPSTRKKNVHRKKNIIVKSIFSSLRSETKKIRNVVINNVNIENLKTI